MFCVAEDQVCVRGQKRPFGLKRHRNLNRYRDHFDCCGAGVWVSKPQRIEIGWGYFQPGCQKARLRAWPIFE